MIGFGSSITEPAVYKSCAQRGFERAAEDDSRVFSQPAAGSIYTSYNLILEQAAACEELESLVLVHQDAEIVDPAFCEKLRAALRDPAVGLVGCVGALGVRSIAWWEGAATWCSFTHRYREIGGGEFPAFSWTNDNLPPYARLGEVEMVDGFVLALSPWAVRNIRFDEALGLPLHGYDFDFCLQVRSADRKVVTADFKVIHHHSLALVGDPEVYVEAYVKLAEKWHGRMPYLDVSGGDWKHRARRAEAEAAAAKAQLLSTRLQIEAREREHQRVVDEALGSVGWRITAPLRRLESRRAARARAERPRSPA